MARGHRDPPRIAMVSRRIHPAHGPGGLERHVFDLVTHLVDAGVGIEIFTEPPAEGWRATALAEALPEAVLVHWVPGGWLPFGTRPGTVVLDRITNYPAWAVRVARWLQRLDGAATLAQEDAASPARWDLFHVHGLAGWGLARAARAGRLAAPIVLTTQGLEEFRAPQLLKRWAYAPFRVGMRTVAGASAAVVTTDVALRPVVEQHLGVPAGEQAVIPNAVDPESCRRHGDPDRGRQLLAGLGLEGASPLYLSVGRVAPNKGYEGVAAALAQAAVDLPEGWAWVLVGDGPSRAGVEAAVRERGLSARCGFAGAVSNDELHSLYAIADWFVHPTLYEGSSLVTLEAMAHGLPVIASRTGGLPDKVADGVTGFLVEPGSQGALTSALLQTSEVDAEAMGAAGQRQCEESFSWQEVTPRYIELYRKLVGRPA